MNGALKENPEAFGAVYPMEFRVPNCDEQNGVPTKTCHCSEGSNFLYELMTPGPRRLEHDQTLTTGQSGLVQTLSTITQL